VKVVVDVVTARAVAPLDKLAGWTLPLVDVGGTVLALKGENAHTELEEASAELERLGGGSTEIVMVGADIVTPATTVVRIVKLKAPRRGGRR
jgi:16S rRNA (guanine527-N7)-methyltransferase